MWDSDSCFGPPRTSVVTAGHEQGDLQYRRSHSATRLCAIAV